MKLTIKKKFGVGWTHVRGGRVLRVTHDHQVSTVGFDGSGPAHVTWVTAEEGDVAVEIVHRGTGKTIGWGYYTGFAINLVRYAPREEAAGTVATWYEEVLGHRTSVLPTMETKFEEYIAAIRRIKYGDAPLTTTEVYVPDNDELKQACVALAKSYGEAKHEHDEARGHLLATVSSTWKLGKKGKVARLHLQPPIHAQEHAVQPFFHDLLASSHHLVDVPFLLPT